MMIVLASRSISEFIKEYELQQKISAPQECFGKWLYIAAKVTHHYRMEKA